MTAAEVEVFTFSHQEVRTVLVDGEPWFVASDVARILGYRDAYNMTRRLDEDERGTRSVSTPSGEQDMTVINEPPFIAKRLGLEMLGQRVAS